MISCNKNKSGVLKITLYCSIVIVSDIFCSKQMADFKEKKIKEGLIGQTFP